MLDRNEQSYIRQVESQMVSYGELVDTLELTVAEQSERLAQSHETEALLAALVESSDDAVIGIDLDLKVSIWNRAAEQLLGYTAAEAVGQDPLSLYVPPGDRDMVRRSIAEDFETLKHQPEVVRRLNSPIMRKDGSVFDASVTACGIRDTRGRVLGISVILIDITERKRVEREQALLAAIVESSDDAIISIAPDLTITSWNKGAEKLLGFTAAEAIGQPTTLYIPPERRQEGEEFLHRLMGKLDHVNSFEVTCLRKDGSRVDTWTVTFGIRDRAGHLIGMSAIHRDLTERKSAEREQALLAALVKSSDDAIFSLSTAFRVITWNQAAMRMFGFTPEEAVGQIISDLIVPPDAKLAANNLMLHDLSALRQNSGFVRHVEDTVRRKDGTCFDVSITASGIYDSGGTLLGVSNVVHDVTERKRAEREREAMASIVNASEDAIAAVDRNEKIIVWNPAAPRIYGFTAAQALGRGLDLFIPPDRRSTQWWWWIATCASPIAMSSSPG